MAEAKGKVRTIEADGDDPQYSRLNQEGGKRMKNVCIAFHVLLVVLAMTLISC